MGAFINLIGERFGRLVVESQVSGRFSAGSKWYCKCDCGNVTKVFSNNLRRGTTTSCGCFHDEVTGNINRTHGLTNTPVYQAWNHMNQRCYNPNDSKYYRYGGRGITVCDQWRYSFENFLSDMGHKPIGVKTSIDRINNDGNYEPSNCEWATYFKQQEHTSRNRWFYAISPIGRWFKSNNQSKFARENNLSSKNINAILNKHRRKTERGWRFYYSA